MLYRNATETDLPYIVEIYNSTIASGKVTADTEPVTVDSKREWFAKHNPDTRPLWVVKSDDDIIVGWVSFGDFYGRPAYNATAEISIYLHKSQRHKGYGKQILEDCIKACGKLKISTLLAYIFEHNDASISLFQSAGFSEWAHLYNIAEIKGMKYSLKILGKKV